MQGFHIDLFEQGRLLCSMIVPPCLLVRTLNFNSLENSISLFAFENWNAKPTSQTIDILIDLGFLLIAQKNIGNFLHGEATSLWTWLAQ